MAYTINLSGIPQAAIAQVEAELPSRASRAANALMNAKNEVLRGQGSGRRYGSHQASAPGQPPTNWHGHLRDSFTPLTNDAHLPGIQTVTIYANYLEDGTKKMAARPFREKILQMAKPEIEAIYSEPWHISI